MFKKSRIKIVTAIMSVLVLLWIGTLTVIYAASYLEMSEQNRGMLKEHAEHYVLAQPSGMPPPSRSEPNVEKPHYSDMPSFQLSTFYTVAMSYDGKILEIKNPQQTVHSNDELEELARGLSVVDKATGVKNNLVYYAIDKGGYMLFAFKDNTIINEGMNTLFRYTLIFGGLAIILLFFVAVYLAKRIVKPLEESYQKQKQFISDAGHELKTPLSVISTNAEILSRELGNNKWLDNIQHENERMGVLVTQLLELSRVENALPITEQIDFSRLVRGEALPFESMAFENGHTLCCNIDENIRVEGNGTQLAQLVSILLDNAISHGDKETDIKLILKAEHGYADLSVINSGTEIPAEKRDMLFERFYRMDSVRNGDDGHYGLGLSIAKAIAVSHGGKISVRCAHGLIEFKVQIPI